MKRKRAKRTDNIEVYWPNPPGSGKGVTIERIVRGHTYRREVGPNGVLTPVEAAKALGVTREFVYRLIWDRKIETVKRRGLIAIPLSSVKAYDTRRRQRRREPYLTG